jgi:hypothetical protein
MLENSDGFRALFNRAVRLTFCRKKLLLSSISLMICGVLIVFFRGLALHANPWMTLSLAFTPIFVCAGVLLALGILLVRIYRDEIRQEEVSYRRTLSSSWELLLGACYFSVPILLCYLLLWIVLGIFVSLREVPVVGDFFGAILVFAPFLINLASLVLFILNTAVLFFATPIFALNGISALKKIDHLLKRIASDPFTHLVLALTALLPLLTCIGVLVMAAFLTGSVYGASGDTLNTIIQWFFVMLPFAALLSPSVVFFFNFAAETHALMRLRSNEDS